ncbi:MAG: enoyl-CoA hydratase/isomerase family protein [Chloroflexi bacterium]|nr:enoyl-CoA hydratase/isomerase family protein [Chloroflexota bacterium]
MSKYSTIILEKDNKIARLILNRPEKLNALSMQTFGEFKDALEDLAADDSISVVILKGAGRAFCAGLELSPEARIEHQNLSYVQDRLRLQHNLARFLQIWDLPKPVIAQVHGYCIGAAVEMVSLTDITIVSEDCQISWPRMLLAAGAEGPFWLPLVGIKKTKEYSFLRGIPVLGTEAVRVGWANRAYPLDQLEKEVEAIAKEVAKIPLEMLSTEKAAINRAQELTGFRQSLAIGMEYDNMVRLTPASRNAIQRVIDEGHKEAAKWRKERA